MRSNGYLYTRFTYLLNRVPFEIRRNLRVLSASYISYHVVMLDYSKLHTRICLRGVWRALKKNGDGDEVAGKTMRHFEILRHFFDVYFPSL